MNKDEYLWAMKHLKATATHSIILINEKYILVKFNIIILNKFLNIEISIMGLENLSQTIA